MTIITKEDVNELKEKYQRSTDILRILDLIEQLVDENEKIKKDNNLVPLDEDKEIFTADL